MVRQYLEKLPKSVEEAAEWYMRYISPLTLVAALLIDTFFLLKRVDTLLTSLVLFFYLTLAATIIVIISLIQTRRLQQWWLLKITPILPVVAQYAFGGLFIAFLSLYSRSASFSFSWIFVGVIALLLFGNEKFVRFYLRYHFQVATLFTVLFSFLIFYLPLVFGQIGPYMFVASGLVSLLLISAFIFLQSKLTPELVKKELTLISRSVAVIFVAFNVLYFTNAIPPLPLALKDVGVYHGVTKVGEDYQLRAEPLEWYEAFRRYDPEYHRVPGEPAYVFTSVFAPTGFFTTIVHEWQHFDQERNTWVTESTIPFTIVGGRDGGFRGYTIKDNPAEGTWRVNVKTEYGQVIGRVSFTVEAVAVPASTETIVR